MKTPYVHYNRKTDTYSVYAWIDNKRKVIARVKDHRVAREIADKAKLGNINTTKYPLTIPSE